MSLGATEMIVDVALGRLVIAVRVGAVPHNAGDDFECMFQTVSQTHPPRRCLFHAPGVRERFENPVLQQAGAGAAFPFGDGVDSFQIELADSDVNHACRRKVFSCWHSMINDTRHCAYSTNVWSVVVAWLLLVGAQIFSWAA